MTVTPLTIIPAAAARVKREGDFKRATLTVRYLLGCRETGFRITVEQNRPGEGHRFEASEISVVMDDEAFERLQAPCSTSTRVLTARDTASSTPTPF